MTLEIDRSYWHLDDKDWVADRKEQWKLVDKWFTENDRWGPDVPRAEHRKVIKAYFEKGIITENFTWWLDLAVLHPQISETTAKELIQLNFDSGDYALKGQYLFYASNAYRFHPLVELGILAEDDLMTIATAFCGKDYEDMARLREFDPYEKAAITTDKILGNFLSNLMFDDSSDRVPKQYLLDHVKSLLRFINTSNIDACQFRLNKFCKGFEKFKVKGRYDTDERKAFAADIQSYLISDAVDPCVHEIARNWIDYSE